MIFNYRYVEIQYTGFASLGTDNWKFFSPGSGLDFFSESGSGSAENPDPIRKNPDP